MTVNNLRLYEGADVEAIYVQDSELGDMHLTIPDIAMPIWGGTLILGRLSIYMAKIIGEPKEPCFALIYVISEQKEQELNGVGFSMYEKAIEPAAAVTHIVEQIYQNCLVKTMKARDETAATIH